MKTRHAIVFVDHQEARVFHIQPAAADVFHPHHHIPRHARGGAETKTNPADQKHFFHDVVAAVTDAAEILVIGPGSAKLELVKYIDEHARTLKPKLVGVETVDHPTDPQILAFARKRFAQIDRMLLGTVLAIARAMTTRVSDLMKRSVLTICRDEPLRAAARAMSSHDVGGLPVLHEGRVVGIISKTDLVDRLADGPWDRETTVADAMSENVLWADADDAVDAVARMMRFEGVHHVVVKNDAGELVGIVTTWDLLALVANAPS